MNITVPALGSLGDLHNAHRRYTEARMVKLTEGARAAGTGDVIARKYASDFYPACSQHGAMNRIGSDVWRCLAIGCNIGCRYPAQRGDG